MGMKTKEAGRRVGLRQSSPQCMRLRPWPWFATKVHARVTLLVLRHSAVVRAFDSMRSLSRR